MVPASWRRKTRWPLSASARSHGYRAFECDVKLSADGVPFLLHDATLARTTNAQGMAGERTWSELSRLDAGGWHSRAFAGEPLPSLQAVAAYVQRNGFALDIEIKPTPGTDAHTGAVVRGRGAAAVAAPGADTAAQFLPARSAACGSARGSATARAHCCSTRSCPAPSSRRNNCIAWPSSPTTR